MVLLLILFFQVQLIYQSKHGFHSQEKALKKKLLNQLNDFDQDDIIGNTASDKQKNTTVNEGTGVEEITVGKPDINLLANENTVNVKTFE